ncbi:PREDICTED: UDP-glucuronosyltransferase 2C1-like [Nicrophorus vespilloides]|uniref:UDP-glucuronosyltransferase n=1 Tax=Nicrophorus vespilloides TaxID=110193 RepID=A0ABM1MJF3_NICVS|nr:PREDICTED: UDP-glucuronosyltransferase 2C1-like [Nicrophorus vespilloides]
MFFVKASLLVLLVQLTLTTHCHGAKILGVFPYPSKSHFILGRTLLKELAARGHEVTMISPFPLDKPLKNYKDVHMSRVMEWKYGIMKEMGDPELGVVRKLLTFYGNLPQAVKMIYEEPELNELLKSGEKFDVAINMMGYTEAILGIGHLLNATNIGFSIMGGMPVYNYHSGIPSPYAYVPNTFYIYNDKMNFLQRVMNTIVSLTFNMLVHFSHYPKQRETLKEYHPTLELNDLIRDVDLYLINSHFATESPRPHLTNTIQIGGFHLYEKEKLPSDLKQFMDESKHGVILFSLGANIQIAKLKPETIQNIISAFSKSKYDFVMKYEKDMPNLPKNIKVSNWLPQKAILEHPKCKAFFTHGGLGGTAEAVYNGVPMVAIPFFGDQRKNVADGLDFGYTIELSFTNITESSMTEAINEITGNAKYASAAKFRSDIYRNQEINPMDKAVFWIEHVAKHRGAKHMKPMATELAWYQYMLIDVFAFLAAIVLLTLSIIYLIIKTLIRLCKKSSNKLKAL